MAGANAKRKHTTITIPTLLFEKLEAKIKGTSFSSVSDYVTYILRELLSESEMRKAGKAAKKGGDEKVEANLVERLRKMGYI